MQIVKCFYGKLEKQVIANCVLDVMGGLCSRRSTSESALHGTIQHVNGHLNYSSGMVYQSHGLPMQENTTTTATATAITQSPAEESMDKQVNEPFSFPGVNTISHGTDFNDIDDGIPRLSRALSNKSRSTRSKQVAMAKVCSLLPLTALYS